MLRLRTALGNYRVLILAGLVLALLGLAGSFGYGAFQAAMADLEQQVAAERRSLTPLRALESERRQLPARLEQAEAALAELLRELRRGRLQPGFLSYAEKSALQAGGVITSLSFGKPVPVAGGSAYFRFPVSLEVVGPYPGIVQMVGRVEQARPFISMEEVEITVASTPASAAPARSAGSETPPSLYTGRVKLKVQMAVLAETGTSVEASHPFSDLISGLGRLNPFEAWGTPRRPAVAGGD